jgi:hypothetical protein
MDVGEDGKNSLGDLLPDLNNLQPDQNIQKDIIR